MELDTLLHSHGQDHLVPSSSLPPELVAQLTALNWPEITKAHDQAGPHRTASLPSSIAPATATQPAPDHRSLLEKEGQALLEHGKAAFVLMAGGQGSRLGYPGPKGCAPLGFPGGKVLFDLISDRLANLSRRCGRPVPFLVMTSPENDAATRDWFGKNAPDLPVRFFQQGTMPAMDARGRVLKAPDGRLALAPDGNGGIFAALARSGELERLACEGVRWLHVAGVDNALSLPCDPVFLGFAQESGAAVASKSVERTDPAEKAGVFRVDPQGNGGVAEYTEIGALAGERAPDGGLFYREANIASHLVRLEMAERFGRSGLPWHLARKVLAHLDPDTGLPGTEAVCKYERFLFDAFPLAGAMALLRVERAREFAPIKNAQGADSPETALVALRQNGELA